MSHKIQSATPTVLGRACSPECPQRMAQVWISGAERLMKVALVLLARQVGVEAQKWEAVLQLQAAADGSAPPGSSFVYQKMTVSFCEVLSSVSPHGEQHQLFFLAMNPVLWLLRCDGDRYRGRQ